MKFFNKNRFSVLFITLCSSSFFATNCILDKEKELSNEQISQFFALLATAAKKAGCTDNYIEQKSACKNCRIVPVTIKIPVQLVVDKNNPTQVKIEMKKDEDVMFSVETTAEDYSFVKKWVKRITANIKAVFA